MNDNRQVKAYIFCNHFSWLLFLKLLFNLFNNMIVARFQIGNLSKDELIDRLLQVENIEDKLQHLNKRFDDFLGKYNEFHSKVLKNSSNLLLNRVIELEIYVRREKIEINLIPGSISRHNL